MASKTTTRTIRNTAQLNAQMRRLRRLPRAAEKAMSAASESSAERIAQDARDRAEAAVGGVARVARYVAPTIEASRGGEPVVSMGGTTRLPSRSGRSRRGPSQMVGAVVAGAEHGARRYPQFSSWVGTDPEAGYVLGASIRADEVLSRHAEALDGAIDEAIG